MIAKSRKLDRACSHPIESDKGHWKMIRQPVPVQRVKGRIAGNEVSARTRNHLDPLFQCCAAPSLLTRSEVL